MRAKLIINSVDFSPWILEEGMKQYEIYRQSRSVVTLDGIEHRSLIVKRGINVSLIRMRDTTWRRLLDALQRRPVEAEYIDEAWGEARRRFHVTEPSATTRRVLGSTTYYIGGTFTLEEQ